MNWQEHIDILNELTFDGTMEWMKDCISKKIWDFHLGPQALGNNCCIGEQLYCQYVLKL
jgi:hypothetical protein